MSAFEKFSERIDTPGFEYTVGDDREAWIGILYACMSADDKVGDIEIDFLSRTLNLKEKFDGTNIPIYYEKVSDAQEMVGSLRLVEACSVAIEHEDKPTIFALAVDIVLADGVLEEDEKLMIAFIAETLAIPEKMIQQIIEVILIRNAGNKVIA